MTRNNDVEWSGQRRWAVEFAWECNWSNPYENADGSPRTFATRAEAEHALEHIDDVYIKGSRDEFRVTEVWVADASPLELWSSNRMFRLADSA